MDIKCAHNLSDRFQICGDQIKFKFGRNVVGIKPLVIKAEAMTPIGICGYLTRIHELCTHEEKYKIKKTCQSKDKVFLNSRKSENL